MKQNAPQLSQPAILPCGDAALVVEFGTTIDLAINARVHALDRALAHTPPRGMHESMPTYGSLLVVYDPLATSFAALSADIRAIDICCHLVAPDTICWRIPVVYGGTFGFDLEYVASLLRLDQQEIIARHVASVFDVFMIGFLPGFTYLGGLDPAIAVPRRPVPRPLIPAGSVVIGGTQTAIGSIAGPSGWHVIGRTPVRAFMPGRAPVVFIKPGDTVVFESHPSDAFHSMDTAAAAGALVAEPDT